MSAAAAPSGPAPAPGPTPAGPSLLRLKLVGLGLLGVLLALDLWTKAHMQDLLGLVPGHPRSAREIDVIPGFLAWQGTWNPGVTFGLARGHTHTILLLTALATLLLLIWFLATRVAGWLLHAGLALILSGAIGNLYDRSQWNEVRDFVLVYLGDLEQPTWTWPNFNVADAAIVTGVWLVIWDALFGLGARRAREARARRQARA